MKIPFDAASRKKYYSLLDQVFDSNFWSEGQMVADFEKKFFAFTGIPSLALCSGGAALLALYEYAGVRDHDVIVPANTFWATAVAAQKAGATIIYADCNRDDLCLSFKDVKKKVTKKTKAIVVVHIGGHIAFEIEQIAAFCKENNIHLIEDCAHAHGASFNGKTAGAWGLGGAYSFYATKTMPLGDGGMVCSNNTDLIEWLGYYRNYGKHVVSGKVSYRIRDGFNARMNEVTAALGIVQLERMPEILSWKLDLAKKYDQIFERRVRFPAGMTSGYYKYIVFDYPLTQQTGKVFDQSDFGPEIEGVDYDLPNSRWIAEHHQCVPIWYGWEAANRGVEEIKKVLLKH